MKGSVQQAAARGCSLRVVGVVGGGEGVCVGGEGGWGSSNVPLQLVNQLERLCGETHR